jgi:hypothetical protein
MIHRVIISIVAAILGIFGWSHVQGYAVSSLFSQQEHGQRGPGSHYHK